MSRPSCRSGLVAGCVALSLAATVVPAEAEDCTVLNTARADEHDLFFFTLYEVRVTSTGYCTPAARDARAEPPLVCTVEGLLLGTPVAAPPAVVGAGVADPRQSNDTCTAFSASALTDRDCTIWSVTGRHFRSAAQVGTATGPEVACAP